MREEIIPHWSEIGHNPRGSFKIHVKYWLFTPTERQVGPSASALGLRIAGKRYTDAQNYFPFVGLSARPFRTAVVFRISVKS